MTPSLFLGGLPKWWDLLSLRKALEESLTDVWIVEVSQARCRSARVTFRSTHQAEWACECLVHKKFHFGGCPVSICQWQVREAVSPPDTGIPAEVPPPPGAVPVPAPASLPVSTTDLPDPVREPLAPIPEVEEHQELADYGEEPRSLPEVVPPAASSRDGLQEAAPAEEGAPRENQQIQEGGEAGNPTATPVGESSWLTWLTGEAASSGSSGSSSSGPPPKAVNPEPGMIRSLFSWFTAPPAQDFLKWASKQKLQAAMGSPYDALEIAKHKKRQMVFYIGDGQDLSLVADILATNRQALNSTCILWGAADGRDDEWLRKKAPVLPAIVVCEAARFWEDESGRRWCSSQTLESFTGPTFNGFQEWIDALWTYTVTRPQRCTEAVRLYDEDLRAVCKVELEGRCPVALRDKQLEVVADRSIIVGFQLKFYCVESEQAAARFLWNPWRYVLGGPRVPQLPR